jgi:hypothetical protein
LSSSLCLGDDRANETRTTTAEASSRSALSASKTPALPVGSAAQVRGTTPRLTDYAIFSNLLIVVPTEDDLSELRRALNAPEAEGGTRIRRLLETADAFGVPNGADVTVTQQGVTGTRIRIEEQGRVYTGKVGWVPSEWVVPRPKPTGTDPSLPSYTVLEKMGTSIHVLVPSIRANSSNLANLLVAITQREGAEQAWFYRTRAAYDANVNGGTDQAEVDRRLRQGLLGSVEHGQFQPPLPF